MRILGIDPSLTNFGWAICNTEFDPGDPRRCEARGRFITPSNMLYIRRYMTIRKLLQDLILKHQPEKMGVEYPVFSALYSEGMYGLFLFCSESLYLAKQDVVFWSPMQVKAHARETIIRPAKWKMLKPDMVEAAKADAGPGVWNHNEADAYLIARLSGRFWMFQGGYIKASDLTPIETKYFTEIRVDKTTGKEKKTGVLYREDERFFQWSKGD